MRMHETAAQPRSCRRDIRLRRIRVVLGVSDCGARRLLAWALLRAGYDVIEIPYAADIPQRIAEAGVDPERARVIISDTSIPGVTPVETLERIRTLDAATPIILFVERAEPPTWAGAFRLGATVLEEPLDLDLALRAVLAAVGGDADAASGEGLTSRGALARDPLEEHAGRVPEVGSDDVRFE
jgi:DNA-binding NtrC family response regulator